MIFESNYWKKDLLRSAKKITQFRCTKEMISEMTLFKIEKILFVGFYIIRKLIESNKLTFKTRDSLVHFKIFKNIKKVDQLNWHNIEKLYNLHSWKRASLPIKMICNQFIHSYVFVPCINQSGSLIGLFVCSDYKRSKQLFYITSKNIIKLFKTVGEDEIIEVRMILDKNRDLKVSELK
jgi:hypothetical protein